MTCGASEYDPTLEAKGLMGHGSFTIERTYPASPERVFAIWATPELKAKWFIGPEGWVPVQRELDFSVGGQELLHGRIQAIDTLFTARYHAIVPNERIVYAYDMHLAGKHHSVSVAAVDFLPSDGGTRMVFTEHVVFLDGTDGVDGTASRELGTAAHLDRLSHHL